MFVYIFRRRPSTILICSNRNRRWTIWTYPKRKATLTWIFPWNIFIGNRALLRILISIIGRMLLWNKLEIFREMSVVNAEIETVLLFLQRSRKLLWTITLAILNGNFPSNRSRQLLLSIRKEMSSSITELTGISVFLFWSTELVWWNYCQFFHYLLFCYDR